MPMDHTRITGIATRDTPFPLQVGAGANSHCVRKAIAWQRAGG